MGENEGCASLAIGFFIVYAFVSCIAHIGDDRNYREGYERGREEGKAEAIQEFRREEMSNFQNNVEKLLVMDITSDGLEDIIVQRRGESFLSPGNVYFIGMEDGSLDRGTYTLEEGLDRIQTESGRNFIYNGKTFVEIEMEGK